MKIGMMLVGYFKQPDVDIQIELAKIEVTPKVEELLVPMVKWLTIVQSPNSQTECHFI